MMNSSSRRIRKWPAYCTSFFFFHQGFLSRTLTTHRTAGEGTEPSYSTLSLPSAHEHSDILFATLHQNQSKQQIIFIVTSTFHQL